MCIHDAKDKGSLFNSHSLRSNEHFNSRSHAIYECLHCCYVMREDFPGRDWAVYKPSRSSQRTVFSSIHLPSLAIDRHYLLSLVVVIRMYILHRSIQYHLCYYLLSAIASTSCFRSSRSLILDTHVFIIYISPSWVFLARYYSTVYEDPYAAVIGSSIEAYSCRTASEIAVNHDLLAIGFNPLSAPVALVWHSWRLLYRPSLP